ncbi:MAG: hypothetical protein LUH42_05700, partial [Oscillospiraceae bacterium]|nr:hypothetical protein [Oscillospiraceae bacterium]
MDTTDKQVAKALLSIRAVFLRPGEPFTWASGIKSPHNGAHPQEMTPPPAPGRPRRGALRRPP